MRQNRVCKVKRVTFSPIVCDERPLGADVQDCLDADDIDAVLKKCIGIRDTHDSVEILSAWQFFRARKEGFTALRKLGERIGKILETKSSVVMPTHTRYHWLTTVFRRDESSVLATVYDSAPSRPVHRDMHSLVRLMFQDVIVEFGTMFPRQLRGSNQCGLFCVLACLIAWRNHGNVDWRGDPGQCVDLHPWRKVLMEKGRTIEQNMKALIQSAPVVRSSLEGPVKTDEERFVNEDGATKPEAVVQSKGAGTKEIQTPVNTTSDPSKKVVGGQPCAGHTRPSTAVVDVEDGNEYDNRIQVPDEDECLWIKIKAETIKERCGLSARELEAFEKRVLEVWKEYQRFEEADLKRVEEEQRALTQIERLSRAAEFRRRLKRNVPDHHLKIEVSLMTRVCTSGVVGEPQGVLVGHLPNTAIDKIKVLAKEQLNANRVQEDTAYLHDIAESLKPDQMINSSVIDACMDAGARIATIAKKWTFIKPLEFERMSNGRDVGLPTIINDNVATITLRNHHFVLLTACREAGKWVIRLFDSMVPDTFSTVHLELLSTLKEFVAKRRSCSSAEIEFPKQPTPVQRQGTNDCGLETLRNLCQQVRQHYGRFSRAEFENIVRRYKSPEEMRSSTKWDELWSTSFERKVRVNDPYACDVLASADPQVSGMSKKSHERLGLGHNRRELRRFIEETPLNSTLLVPWKAFGEEGQWLGTLIKKFSPGIPAKVRYFAEWCPKCAEWHSWYGGDNDMEPGEVFDLPSFHSIQYGAIINFSKQLEGTDLTPNCGKHSRDDDDAEAPTDTTNLAKVCDEMRQRMDKEPIGDQGPIDPLLNRASFLRSIFIFDGKPTHVHNVVWKRRANSTRMAHIRWLKHLRVMDDDLCHMELPKAIVEFVLRWCNRRGRSAGWATVANYLSTIGAALESLSIYSTHEDVRIRSSKYFSDAVAFSAVKAREENATNGNATAPLTFEMFSFVIRTITNAKTQALLAMSWFFAGRVGDMRRVQRRNIHISDERSDSALVKLLITEGKSVTWSGPYWLAARVPLTWVTRWREIAREGPGAEHMFDEESQKQLSKVCASLQVEGHAISLRSIRKGALIHHCDNGISLPELQILAHHGSLRTLQRYLGWGTDDNNVIEAAERRYEAEDPEESFGGSEHPMWMGLNSGTTGYKGRRFQEPVAFCPTKPPSRKELGLEENANDNDLMLHVGDLETEVNLKEVLKMTTTPELKSQVEHIMEWLSSSRHYGVTWQPLSKKEIPRMSFTPDQEKELLIKKKMRRFEGIVRSASKGFGHIEARKGRIRPVFETLINKSMDRSKLPCLKYPSRYERRVRATEGSLFIEFDFAAFYDQFVIPKTLSEFFVVKGHDGLYSLTRLPMGCSFAAHVAQITTWAILEPILQRAEETGRIEVISCIDNVAFSSDYEEDFLWAIKTFKERARLANAIIKKECDYARLLHNAFVESLKRPDSFPKSLENIEALLKKGLCGKNLGETAIQLLMEPYRQDIMDTAENALNNGQTVTMQDCEQHLQRIADVLRSEPQESDRDVIEWARFRALTPHEFLGETLRRTNNVAQVRNPQRHLDKLLEAFERLQKNLDDPSIAITPRNVAALLGLINFLALTVDLKLCNHIELTRLFTIVGRCSTVGGWDGTWRVTAHQVTTIGRAVGVLIRNVWTNITAVTMPSASNADYQMIAIVDASRSGWASVVRLRDGTVVEVRAGWPCDNYRFSAHAEPNAIVQLLQYTHRMGWCFEGDNIAIVTDHEAIPMKQERAWKKTGGFSSAFYLNEVFAIMGRLKTHIQYFYVVGERNPADRSSRSSNIGDPIRHKRLTDVVFPPLSEFQHPYLHRERIEWWQR